MSEGNKRGCVRVLIGGIENSISLVLCYFEGLIFRSIPESLCSLVVRMLDEDLGGLYANPHSTSHELHLWPWASWCFLAQPNSQGLWEDKMGKGRVTDAASNSFKERWGTMYNNKQAQQSWEGKLGGCWIPASICPAWPMLRDDGRCTESSGGPLLPWRNF